MEMKKLLESLDECGMNEMPGMPPAMPPQEVDKGNPVSMNVSINASGKDHVEDLLNMMKNAGLGDAKPVDAKMLAPRLDMERLRDIVDSPMDDPEIPGKDDVDGDKDITAMGCNDDIEYEEGYENEPEPRVGDIEDVTPDGDDLHRSKDRKAIRTNDPALENIKADLYAALSEKKAKPDYIDIDGDGDKKEPMKKAVKDKEEKKVKEADDGKCPECGKPGKKKLMACSGCGCK
jgi:hypothetical protein